MINVAVTGSKDIITFEAEDGTALTSINVNIAAYTGIGFDSKRANIANDVEAARNNFLPDDRFKFNKKEGLSFTDLRISLIKYFFPTLDDLIEIVMNELMGRVRVTTVDDGFYDSANPTNELTVAQDTQSFRSFIKVYYKVLNGDRREDTNYCGQVHHLADLIKNESLRIITRAGEEGQDVQRIRFDWYDVTVRDFENANQVERVIVKAADSSAIF